VSFDAIASAAPSPAITRLNRLAPLSEAEKRALELSIASARRIPPHRDILVEGGTVPEPVILAWGWAARLRQFSDGKRQVLSFLLPGELIGTRRQRDPLAATTIVAITEIGLCTAPQAARGEALAEAYAVSAALEETYLFRQIARLGRMSAQERLIDCLLEMRERLTLAGLAEGDSFPLPLTQELLADALGLTSVHVNRTLQSMRREQLVEIRSGRARISQPDQLAQMVDFHPARVS
jgi:CRP-like cAMP-binding protein